MCSSTRSSRSSSRTSTMTGMPMMCSTATTRSDLLLEHERPLEGLDVGIARVAGTGDHLDVRALGLERLLDQIGQRRLIDVDRAVSVVRVYRHADLDDLPRDPLLRAHCRRGLPHSERDLDVTPPTCRRR